MNFEMLVEFGENLRRVKGFKYFPREWEPDYLEKIPYDQREIFPDFAIKSLENLDLELPNFDDAYSKDFTGFLEGSKDLYNVTNLDKIYGYYKKGELKYLQAFQKGEHFDSFRIIFFENPFSLTKYYYSYGGEEYGKLALIKRSGVFKSGERNEVEVLQFSKNNFEIGFNVEDENLFNVSINPEKNKDHLYISNKIRENPSLFYDSGSIQHLLSNSKIRTNEKYKIFEKMSFKDALNQWAGFK